MCEWEGKWNGLEYCKWAFGTRYRRGEIEENNETHRLVAGPRAKGLS